MTACVRPQPCEACPYRKDVPSGVWAPEEYEKLRAYDRPTAEQPMGAFLCHAAPGSMCHGWAVVHTTRGHQFDLLALRFEPVDVPEAAVPLFASGNEAADHGLRDVKRPTVAAVTAAARLLSKHARLRAEVPCSECGKTAAEHGNGHAFHSDLLPSPSGKSTFRGFRAQGGRDRGRR